MSKGQRMKNRLLNEAKRIGDKLLLEAKKDGAGLSWETMGTTGEQEIIFSTADGVYNGVSGIVLFLLELYRVTQERKYLDAAEEGIRWIIGNDSHKKNSDTDEPDANLSAAFFTGRMGAVYTLLRMNEFSALTRRNDYIEHALRIGKTLADLCMTQLSLPYIPDDFINGRSGTLIAFLHLHAATGAPWILPLIDSLIRHLLKSGFHGPSGMYWDRAHHHVTGLCGFSHGASGIGFTFLELAHYFKNDAFVKAAEQAFMYEQTHFNESLKNWPDFRTNCYNEQDQKEFETAFLEGQDEIFYRTSDMNAWCHGAAGIGLSRLRAYQLATNPAQKENYLKDAINAIQRTSADMEKHPEQSRRSFTLCHGAGGNADLFLYAYQVLKDPQYLQMAEKTAQQGIDLFNKNQFYYSGFSFAEDAEDRSLFMGNAGVGYFYLRTLDPLNVPSVMIPPVNAVINENESLHSYPFINITTEDILKTLLHKDYRRTLAIAEAIAPGNVATFFQEKSTPGLTCPSLPAAFSEFIESLLPAIDQDKQELLSEIYGLESEKRQMEESIRSHVKIFIKEVCNNKKASELIDTLADPEAFKDMVFQLDSDARITITDWDWNKENEQQWKTYLEMERDPEAAEDHALLIKSSAMEVSETVITPFQYIIMYGFAEPNSVRNVCQSTLESFEALTPEDEIMLAEKVIIQVKQLLLAGILVTPS